MESQPVNGCAITFRRVPVRAAHASSLDVIGDEFDPSRPRPTLPEVRFSSGLTVYIERLVDGRWTGRYWSADGRLPVTREGWADSAFDLTIGRDRLVDGWSLVEAHELPPTERGARHYVVELDHAAQGIGVAVHTTLDGTAVLTRWLEITNHTEGSVALTDVAPLSGRLFPAGMCTLGRYTRELWAGEAWFEWLPLPPGPTVVTCDLGKGWGAPFFVLRNEVTGEYAIGHLAWSANWEMRFTQGDLRSSATEGGTSLRIGPKAVEAQRIIAPGERVTTPAVHLGLVAGSLDDAVQAMHAHLRRSVMPIRPPERDALVQFLVPADQGYYEPFDEASAFKCADVAAALGAEIFVLDYGWWDTALDWEPSAKRFPHGLEPLIDYVRSKGMLFGFYIESEGGRGDARQSRVGRAHPDWFGPRDVLKLSIPEAAAWMESEIVRLVDKYRLDLWRLYYNPEPVYEGPSTLRDGLVENDHWRYYEAFYAVYERIARRYPSLILQQAAAGGARNDLGTAGRFHESYVTDGLHIPRELQIYAGTTLGLPPENLLILHGADGAIGVGRPRNIDSVLRILFTLSTPQVFTAWAAPSVEELSPLRRERFVHYVTLYKQFIRPLLSTARLYHHEPINAQRGVEDSPWFALEFAAPDRSKGWATVIRMRNGPGDRYVTRYPHETIEERPQPAGALWSSPSYTLVPRGLDPARRYRVTFDSLGTTTEVDGLRLTQQGLTLRLENVGMSELLLFEAL
ncbi:MAG: hypothetical protein GX557_00060 [Chloroflexi bacterium]|nr:hypothetical protein [Chloroflexota bacterium]